MRNILVTLALVLSGAVLYGVVKVLPSYFEDKRPSQALLQGLEVTGMINFEGKTIEGKDFRLQEYKGKIIILSFWASWCAPCVEEMPSMIKLIEMHGDQIQLVAVSADYTIDDLQRFLKALKVRQMPALSVLWDQENKISELYNVQKLPETYIFGVDGKLIKKVVGTADWAGPDAIGFFSSLMKK